LSILLNAITGAYGIQGWRSISADERRQALDQRHQFEASSASLPLSARILVSAKVLMALVGQCLYRLRQRCEPPARSRAQARQREFAMPTLPSARAAGGLIRTLPPEACLIAISGAAAGFDAGAWTDALRPEHGSGALPGPRKHGHSIYSSTRACMASPCRSADASPPFLFGLIPSWFDAP